MRFDVRYRTLLAYDELAVDSHNEIRARPADTTYQRVLDYTLFVSPPASIHQFVDGWGTVVDSFGVRLPHIAMEVIAEATVETTQPPELTALVPMSALGDPTFEGDHYEYLVSTPATEPSASMLELASDVRQSSQHVLGLVTSLQAAVRSRLAYRPGATTVSTTAAEAFALEAGVCQDYAHVMASLARACGLPTRYVSGYFFTSADDQGADHEDDLVTVQTHAWVEIAIPGHRWMAIDPTNGRIPGERHVKIGHGPDYSAVMPFRGTFIGPESSEVAASVQIRRQNGGGGQPVQQFTTSSEMEARLAQAEAAFVEQQQQQQQ